MIGLGIRIDSDKLVGKQYALSFASANTDTVLLTSSVIAPGDFYLEFEIYSIGASAYVFGKLSTPNFFIKYNATSVAIRSGSTTDSIMTYSGLQVGDIVRVSKDLSNGLFRLKVNGVEQATASIGTNTADYQTDKLIGFKTFYSNNIVRRWDINAQASYTVKGNTTTTLVDEIGANDGAIQGMPIVIEV